MKLFAMTWLLPHVRAWSWNPPLPMLPARPEPSPLRALDARGEARPLTALKYWNSLTHKGTDRIAAACGGAHLPNGSASW